MARTEDEIGDTMGEATIPEVEPETTPEELTDEEVDRLAPEIQETLTRMVNAEKANLGRTLKTTLEAQSVLQRNYDGQGRRLAELQETIKTLRQRERERELKAAEGTPDLVDSVRLKHQAEDEWEKVNKARSEHETEVSRWQTKVDKSLKIEAEEKARELSKESGLNADLLLQIGSDTAENGRVTYNLKRMESIAKSVPKSEEEEEPETIKGQRARAAGSGSRSATRGLQTMEDYDVAYNVGKIDTEEYQKARIRFGVAY